MRKFRSLAIALVMLSVATACIAQEAPEPEVVIFVPKLTISDQPSRALETFDYEPGEPTGFTAHLSDDDARTLGLPQVLALVGRTPIASTSTVTAPMKAYEGEGRLAIPERFDCFDPIEIRNAEQETILTVNNFCPADNEPELTIIGDMSAGTSLGWVFASPDGTSRNNLDAVGNILDSE